jgi:hypothetical protein
MRVPGPARGITRRAGFSFWRQGKVNCRDRCEWRMQFHDENVMKAAVLALVIICAALLPQTAAIRRVLGKPLRDKRSRYGQEI